MKSFKQLLIAEATTTVRPGLHQAKVGDHIHIGFEGTRGKWPSKIAKIDHKTGRLTDTDGNIFNVDGRVFRRKSAVFPKGKIVSAKIVSQKEFDKEFKRRKIEFLRKFDWDRMNIEDLVKITEMLPVRHSSAPKTSRFER